MSQDSLKMLDHHWISMQYDFALSESDDYPPPSRADSPLLGQQFEGTERDRALKFLIQEMNLGRVFPCATREPIERHEKSLPPLPPPVPPSSPYSSPTQSRRPSYSNLRARPAVLPSISTTLDEVDTPTPTPTPAPTTRAPAPAPLKLFSTFESQRAFPPSPTPTTNASTPALSPSSPLPSSYQTFPHSRSASFPESLFSASSGPASPTSLAYMPQDPTWPVPIVTTTGGSDEDVHPDEHPYPFPSHDKLTVPAPCESRWSLASSNPDEDDALHQYDASPKTSSKRKRLFSLISMLSPSAREAKENRRISMQSRTTPPSPTASSVYLAGNALANASSVSNDFGLDPTYNPYYDNSTSDSSLSSNVKGSLTSLGYARRSFGKPKKRTLVVGGVKEGDVRTHSAVRQWCESFGELRSFSRRPNGEIHVDFRKLSVADTVCRVRGNVLMNGASVHLSWFSGKKI